MDLQDDGEEGTSGIASPTIPIPASRHVNLTNISELMRNVYVVIFDVVLIGCEVGSRKSETDSILEKKSLTSQSDSETTDQRRSSSVGSFSRLPLKNKRTEPKISDMSSDSIIWLSHR